MASVVDKRCGRVGVGDSLLATKGRPELPFDSVESNRRRRKATAPITCSLSYRNVKLFCIAISIQRALAPLRTHLSHYFMWHLNHLQPSQRTRPAVVPPSDTDATIATVTVASGARDFYQKMDHFSAVLPVGVVTRRARMIRRIGKQGCQIGPARLHGLLRRAAARGARLGGKSGPIWRP